MLYLAIREDNRPHNETPTVWLYKNDGYRFWVRWVSGPQINLNPAEWSHVMEYKQANYGEECLVNFILQRFHGTEAEALAAPIDGHTLEQVPLETLGRFDFFIRIAEAADTMRHHGAEFAKASFNTMGDVNNASLLAFHLRQVYKIAKDLAGPQSEEKK